MNNYNQRKRGVRGSGAPNRGACFSRRGRGSSSSNGWQPSFFETPNYTRVPPSNYRSNQPSSTKWNYYPPWQESDSWQIPPPPNYHYDNRQQDCYSNYTFSDPTKPSVPLLKTSVDFTQIKSLPNKQKPLINSEQIHPVNSSELPKNLNKSKLLQIINSSTTLYEPAMKQLVKEKRLQLSRELRNMYNSENTVFKPETVDQINSIIPDLGVDLHNLPPQFISTLSDVLQTDLDCEENFNSNMEDDKFNKPLEPPPLIPAFLMQEFNEFIDKKEDSKPAPEILTSLDVDKTNEETGLSFELPSNIEDIQIPTDVSAMFDFSELDHNITEKDENTSNIETTNLSPIKIEIISNELFQTSMKLNEISSEKWKSPENCKNTEITVLSPILCEKRVDFKNVPDTEIEILSDSLVENLPNSDNMSLKNVLKPNEDCTIDLDGTLTSKNMLCVNLNSNICVTENIESNNLQEVVEQEIIKEKEFRDDVSSVSDEFFIFEEVSLDFKSDENNDIITKSNSDNEEFNECNESIIKKQPTIEISPIKHTSIDTTSNLLCIPKLYNSRSLQLDKNKNRNNSVKSDKVLSITKSNESLNVMSNEESIISIPKKKICSRDIFRNRNVLSTSSSSSSDSESSNQNAGHSLKCHLEYFRKQITSETHNNKSFYKHSRMKTKRKSCKSSENDSNILFTVKDNLYMTQTECKSVCTDSDGGSKILKSATHRVLTDTTSDQISGTVFNKVPETDLIVITSDISNNKVSNETSKSNLIKKSRESYTIYNNMNLKNLNENVDNMYQINLSCDESDGKVSNEANKPIICTERLKNIPNKFLTGITSDGSDNKISNKVSQLNLTETINNSIKTLKSATDITCDKSNDMVFPENKNLCRTDITSDKSNNVSNEIAKPNISEKVDKCINTFKSVTDITCDKGKDIVSNEASKLILSEDVDKNAKTINRISADITYKENKKVSNEIFKLNENVDNSIKTFNSISGMLSTNITSDKNTSSIDLNVPSKSNLTKKIIESYTIYDNMDPEILNENVGNLCQKELSCDESDSKVSNDANKPTISENVERIKTSKSVSDITSDKNIDMVLKEAKKSNITENIAKVLAINNTNINNNIIFSNKNTNISDLILNNPDEIKDMLNEHIAENNESEAILNLDSTVSFYKKKELNDINTTEDKSENISNNKNIIIKKLVDIDLQIKALIDEKMLLYRQLMQISLTDFNNTDSANSDVLCTIEKNINKKNSKEKTKSLDTESNCSHKHKSHKRTYKTKQDKESEHRKEKSPPVKRIKKSSDTTKSSKNSVEENKKDVKNDKTSKYLESEIKSNTKNNKESSSDIKKHLSKQTDENTEIKQPEVIEQQCPSEKETWQLKCIAITEDGMKKVKNETKKKNDVQELETNNQESSNIRTKQSSENKTDSKVKEQKISKNKSDEIFFEKLASNKEMSLNTMTKHDLKNKFNSEPEFSKVKEHRKSKKGIRNKKDDANVQKLVTKKEPLNIKNFLDNFTEIKEHGTSNKNGSSKISSIQEENNVEDSSNTPETILENKVNLKTDSKELRTSKKSTANKKTDNNIQELVSKEVPLNTKTKHPLKTDSIQGKDHGISKKSSTIKIDDKNKQYLDMKTNLRTDTAMVKEPVMSEKNATCKNEDKNITEPLNKKIKIENKTTLEFESIQVKEEPLNMESFNFLENKTISEPESNLRETRTFKKDTASTSENKNVEEFESDNEKSSIIKFKHSLENISNSEPKCTIKTVRKWKNKNKRKNEDKSENELVSNEKPLITKCFLDNKLNLEPDSTQVIEHETTSEKVCRNTKEDTKMQEHVNNKEQLNTRNKYILENKTDLETKSKVKEQVTLKTKSTASNKNDKNIQEFVSKNKSLNAKAEHTLENKTNLKSDSTQVIESEVFKKELVSNEEEQLITRIKHISENKANSELKSTKIIEQGTSKKSDTSKKDNKIVQELVNIEGEPLNNTKTKHALENKVNSESESTNVMDQGILKKGTTSKKKDDKNLQELVTNEEISSEHDCNVKKHRTSKTRNTISKKDDKILQESVINEEASPKTDINVKERKTRNTTNKSGGQITRKRSTSSTSSNKRKKNDEVSLSKLKKFNKNSKDGKSKTNLRNNKNESGNENCDDETLELKTETPKESEITRKETKRKLQPKIEDEVSDMDSPIKLVANRKRRVIGDDTFDQELPLDEERTKITQTTSDSKIKRSKKPKIEKTPESVDNQIEVIKTITKCFVEIVPLECSKELFSKYIVNDSVKVSTEIKIESSENLELKEKLILPDEKVVSKIAQDNNSVYIEKPAIHNAEDQIEIDLKSKNNTIENTTSKQSETTEENTPIWCNKHSGSVLVTKIYESFLYAACEDGKIYKYLLADGSLVACSIGHKLAVTCMVITPDLPRYIFSGSLDGTMQCYTTDLKQIVQPVELENPVQSMDSLWGLVFMGTVSGYLYRYCIEANKLADGKREIAETALLAIKATREGPRRVLVVAPRCQPVSVRDAMSGLLLRYVTPHPSPTIYSILLEAGLVYCGTSQKFIVGYDFANGEQKEEYTAGKGIVCLLIKKDLLFAGCYDGLVYVFNTITKQLLTTIHGPGTMVLAIAVVNEKIIIGCKNSKLIVMKMPEVILNHCKLL